MYHLDGGTMKGEAFHFNRRGFLFYILLALI